MNSNFEIIDGLILRKGAWSAKTLNDWQRTFIDDREIESIINHVTLVQFYWLKDDEYLEHNDLLVIGKQIKEAWETELNKTYPEKSIEVFFNSDMEKDGFIGNMNVTVCHSNNDT
ncbi:MAG: hypothetical protein AB8B80_05600 [Marinicellaceae bacterium]